MIQTVIGKEYPRKVSQLIEKATSKIDIIMFDWRWYASDSESDLSLFNQSILRANRRGVKTRAVINSDVITEKLNEVGIQCHNLKSKKMLHCKMINIDDRILVIGSHNFTHSAFSVNHELSVIISGEFVPDRILEYFNNLFNYV